MDEGWVGWLAVRYMGFSPRLAAHAARGAQMTDQVQRRRVALFKSDPRLWHSAFFSPATLPEIRLLPSHRCFLFASSSHPTSCWLAAPSVFRVDMVWSPRQVRVLSLPSPLVVLCSASLPVLALCLLWLRRRRRAGSQASGLRHAGTSP
jgi:MYXO-CTERM domain-containing protein